MANAVRAIFWLIFSLEMFKEAAKPMDQTVLGHLLGETGQLVFSGLIFVVATWLMWKALRLVDKG